MCNITVIPGINIIRKNNIQTKNKQKTEQKQNKKQLPFKAACTFVNKSQAGVGDLQILSSSSETSLSALSEVLPCSFCCFMRRLAFANQLEICVMVMRPA